jgi:hypothetical protein
MLLAAAPSPCRRTPWTGDLQLEVSRMVAEDSAPVAVCCRKHCFGVELSLVLLPGQFHAVHDQSHVRGETKLLASVILFMLKRVRHEHVVSHSHASHHMHMQ